MWTGHSNSTSSYRQCFDELNVQGFNFSNAFKCSDVYKFEKFETFSINLNESSFYQYKKMET